MKIIHALVVPLLFAAGCDFYGNRTEKKAEMRKDVKDVGENAIHVKGAKDVLVVAENGDTFLEGNFCGTSKELHLFFARLSEAQPQQKPEPENKGGKGGKGGKGAKR